jgi:type VII secretion-associated serine protease mycosin
MAMLVAIQPAGADEARDKQWHLGSLDVAAAQRISQGDGVTVALIDTGVKADHVDLSGNVLKGVDLTGAGSEGQKDTDGHGTAMAGLIAAHGHGNSDGALGIAPRAKIFPIRESASGKDVGSAKLPAAIDQAVKSGARVLSMSLVTGSTDALKQAVQRALDADIVVVAGAGNKPKSAYVGYPAAFPGVVAVGASGRDGKIAPVSVTGDEIVISAPGADIASTSDTGAYEFSDGTSNSTAIVAGAAALIRSKYPELSAKEVVHRLTATADDKGAPGRDPEYGYGTLNLVKALTADVQPGDTGPTAAPGPTTTRSSVALPQADPVDGGIKLSPIAYILGGLVLLVLLGGVVGLVVWLIARGRRRPPTPSYPQQPQYAQGPPGQGYNPPSQGQPSDQAYPHPPPQGPPTHRP